MKRKLSLILSAILCALPLSACDTRDEILTPPTLDPNKTESQAQQTPEQPVYSGAEAPDLTVAPLDDEKLRDALTHFSGELFRNCSMDEKGENTLVSPLSVYMALSMLNNGAVSDTHTEMTDVLSGYIQRRDAIVDYADHAPLSADTINTGMNTLMNSFNSADIMKIANAVYIMERKDVRIQDDFLTTAREQYGAEIFKEVYSDKTVKNINNWVNKKTNEMIPSILTPESLNENTVSVLLNAIAFEGEWAEEYEDADVLEYTFHNYDGSDTVTDFLLGFESTYFEDEYASGFKKMYKTQQSGACYSFVAILPNEDITIDEYISDHLSGETVRSFAKDAFGDVVTDMPKFTFDKEYKLPSTLQDMGINKAFSRDDANFTDFAVTDDGYPVFISDVIHKTHIEVDEHGTKASAATAIIMEKNVEMVETQEPHYVILDRPFVFAIYDEVNELPVFIGKVCGI